MAGAVHVLLALLVATAAAQEPVKVSVFFETLCPDSIAFFNSQLEPAWNTIRDIMEVDLTAYGFATATPSGDGYVFDCQHGDDECQGNKVEACAKAYISDYETYVDFSICLMTGEYPPTEGETCAEKVGVEWAAIGECAQSTEGETLLYLQGQEQDALQPAPDWIPWIIINDVYTADNLVEAQLDLIGLVCRTYEGTPPAGCS
ncbi:gamma-interferon-inducible lysosomal thiol reductase [Procambarus clarkii]|uniref:gamma-interferon-inducible lysosomal thiol reductase n=1 Tax=Procambarus clarkii TaxID=6728 RepID=UPI001E672A90|nr:gamma-interferon-inducible lysosomal thiol reductase-like [Procambarus clarkii]